LKKVSDFDEWQSHYANLIESDDFILQFTKNSETNNNFHLIDSFMKYLKMM